MKRTDELEPIQRRLMRPFNSKVNKATLSPRKKSVFRVSVALSSMILDPSVPVTKIRRDLEDIREIIDFALATLAGDGRTLN